MSQEEDRQRWQDLAHAPGAQSLLDLAINAAAASSELSVLARALCVEPVYCPQGDGGIATSLLGSGKSATTYVHAYTTPVRLTTAWGSEAGDHTIVETLLPALMGALPAGTGVRLDPGLAHEVVLSAAQVHEVRATANGLPTRSALTPVDGENLTIEQGPPEVTLLDRVVVEAIAEVSPEARLRRATATLRGIGGRIWPVYSVTGSGLDRVRVTEAAMAPAQGAVVVLVNGEPSGLAQHLDVDPVALPLTASGRLPVDG